MKLIDLLESRIDFLQTKYLPILKAEYGDLRNMPIKSIILAVDGNTPSEKLFNYLVSLDPTNKKIYLQWILDRFISDTLKSDEFRYVKEILEQYEILKKDKNIDSQFRDINRFRTYRELERFVQNNDNDKSIVNDLDFERALDESKILYNGPDLMVVSPENQDASCILGRGTAWCTAYGDPNGRYPDRDNNLFDYYNKNGPLYIIIDKKTKEKWQLHFNSNQLMDSEDEEYPWIKLGQQYPVLYKVFGKIAEQTNSLVFNEHPSEEVMEKSVKDDPYTIQYIKNPSDDLKMIALMNDVGSIQFIKDPTETQKMYAVSRAGSLLKYIKDPTEELQLTAIKNTGVAIAYVEHPSLQMMKIAVENAPYSFEYFYKKNPPPGIIKQAIRTWPPNLKFIDKPWPDQLVKLALHSSIENLPPNARRVAQTFINELKAKYFT